MYRTRSRRRSLRRAVAVPCGLQSSYWDGALTLPASDLSNEGVWIDTPLPLEPGEEIVLSFNPPGQPRAELWATAEVARVGMWRRSVDSFPVGMGLIFTYVSDLDRALLRHALRGRPPRLPSRRLPPPLPARACLPAATEADLPRVLAPGARPAFDVPRNLTFTCMATLLTSPQPRWPSSHRV